MKTYCSNQLEYLGKKLEKDLFIKGEDPFLKRIVVVPHFGLVHYLQKTLPFSIGIEYKTLLEATLYALDSPYIPSQSSLAFYLEPLLPHLQTHSKALRFLSDDIASLFYRCAVTDPLAQSLLLTKDPFLSALWNQLFIQQQLPLFSAMLENASPANELRFFFFGFAHIPLHFRQFFQKASPIFYCLSPSAMFWEDFCTDKERIFIEKTTRNLQAQEQLHSLLQEQHPLLVALGKAGRDLLSYLGEQEQEEEFFLSSSGSCLSSLQNHLLTLEIPKEKTLLSPQDTSLRIASTPSLLREVEALWDFLYEHLSPEGILPKDVLVLCYELDRYVPYIEAVFGKEESPFAYTIYDVTHPSISQDITLLFSLLRGRCTQDDIFTFLSYRWKAEDITLLRSLFAPVTWGLSARHRQYFLDTIYEKNTPSSSRTWQEVAHMVLQECAYSRSSLSWKEIELLETFLCFIDQIEKQALSLYEPKEKTLQEWISIISPIACFHPIASLEGLWTHLQEIDRELSSRISHKLSWESFERILSSYQPKSSIHSSLLHSISFLPASMGAAYPAKILYVLGCDEESLPRQEKNSPFLPEGFPSSSPLLAEQDRYFFLELLLHARCHLVFSYVRICAQDQKERKASRIIQEILRYLDAHYCCSREDQTPSEVFTIHHPAIPPYRQYPKQKKTVEPFWQWAPASSTPAKIPAWISIQKLGQFAKHPIKFYLKEIAGLYFPFSPPPIDELFFSPLLKKKISRLALHPTQEQEASFFLDAYKLEGSFGKIEEKALQEELLLQKKAKGNGTWETVELIPGLPYPQYRNHTFFLPALAVPLPEELCVGIYGKIEPLSSEGLIWLEKNPEESFPFLWPSLLVFLLIAPQLPCSRACLLWESKTFFSPLPEDPQKLLQEYILFYLTSIHRPCPIHPKWALPLLQTDKPLTEKNVPPFASSFGFIDPYDQWSQERITLPTPSFLSTHWQKRWQQLFSRKSL